MTASAVLVTGGSGYLGGFLACHCAASGCHVGLTYHSSPPTSLPKNVQAFQVDLANGEGLDACLADLTAGGRQLVAVVNCAAISQPAACERDPAAAEAVNVPAKLLDALERWWQQRKEEQATAAAAAVAEQQQQAQQQQQKQAQQHAEQAQQTAQPEQSGILRLLSRLSGGGRGLARRSGSGGGGLARRSSSGLGSDNAGGSTDGSHAGCDGGTGQQPPLFVQLSTDQVYDGSKTCWTEQDEPAPINAYGRSKLAAEREVAARWPNHAILRSSLIYGPEPRLGPVGRPLFLQFIDRQLSKGASAGLPLVCVMGPPAVERRAAQQRGSPPIFMRTSGEALCVRGTWCAWCRRSLRGRASCGTGCSTWAVRNACPAPTWPGRWQRRTATTPPSCGRCRRRRRRSAACPPLPTFLWTPLAWRPSCTCTSRPSARRCSTCWQRATATEGERGPRGWQVSCAPAGDSWSPAHAQRAGGQRALACPLPRASNFALVAVLLPSFPEIFDRLPLHPRSLLFVDRKATSPIKLWHCLCAL
ncbi:hypothetical protein ABPG75_003680 [Micractinium tetrahymenae]